MRARLTALIRQYSAGQELAEKTGLDPALMERLKSLGYAGFSGGGKSDRSRAATYCLIPKIASRFTN